MCEKQNKKKKKTMHYNNANVETDDDTMYKIT